jgi:signal transduction histidine kinase
MLTRNFKEKVRKLDIRAKITLVISGVMIPTFLLLIFLVYQFIQPTLLREIEQIGISTGRTLAEEMVSQRWLSKNQSETFIENRLREFLYLQPNIRRIEVFVLKPGDVNQVQIASTVEEDPSEISATPPLVPHLQSKLYSDLEPGENGWEILIPIRSSPQKESKIIGTIRLFTSIQLVNRLGGIVSKVTLISGFAGMLVLFFLLNTALRRTIENDRKLREAENQNLFLAKQLHEAERDLMNYEKLAVMGQLTASFAHEIGTPLNAIGGHLGLVRDELSDAPSSTRNRLEIIEGQVSKITEIVKGFLTNTSKPPSQKQLVDPHAVVDRTLSIIRPRLESLGVKVEKNFNRSLGPIRVVPLELEQMLLNLFNNSLDSMKSKGQTTGSLLLMTDSVRKDGLEYLVISVKDSGEGISSKDLPKIMKPFFTTKAPGEGTGLGLTICSDIAHKYGGSLGITSEVGQWTEVQIEIPYSKG